MISLSAHKYKQLCQHISINNSVQISKCIYGNLPEHSNYLDKSRRELHCILVFKYLYSHSTSPVLYHLRNENIFPLNSSKYEDCSIIWAK